MEEVGRGWKRLEEVGRGWKRLEEVGVIIIIITWGATGWPNSLPGTENYFPQNGNPVTFIQPFPHRWLCCAELHHNCVTKPTVEKWLDKSPPIAIPRLAEVG